MQQVPVFRGLSAVERAHLRELSTLLLHRKSFSGTQGGQLSVHMAVAVAAQACLLILKLGLGYFDGWSEVLIYPGPFRVVRDVTDATGVVSHQDNVLGGEAWSRGPVILAWEMIDADLAAYRPGQNVVLHEFAHKLDMLNGRANGMPPLHPDMVRERWTRVFSDAFERLQAQLAAHGYAGIDGYAATDPAEFFAVSSEYFFAAPDTLRPQFPEVYAQLVLFYRQDPGRRLAALC